MTTTATNLMKLNALRSQCGMPALKSWKGSTSALQTALEKMRMKATAAQPLVIDPNMVKQIPPSDPTLVREAKRREKVASLAKKLQEARDADERAAATADIVTETKPPVVKAPAKVTTYRRREVPAGSITLADIARELGISPKVARAKMRRIRLKDGVELSRYCYKPEHKADVVHILRHKQG